jgi:uncharacterized protein YfaA (DUF2138 family)
LEDLSQLESEGTYEHLKHRLRAALDGHEAAGVFGSDAIAQARGLASRARHAGLYPADGRQPADPRLRESEGSAQVGISDTEAAKAESAQLITSEFERSKVARARENLTAGGLSDLVEIREGDALQTLARDLPESIDLLLLDGAKALYADVFKLVESRVRPDAFIVADDAGYCPEYLEHVRSTASGYLSVPFGEDVEVSMRIG